MTPGLVLNAEIRTRPLPLGTVGQDTAPAYPVLGHKMGQFVKKCALNFFRSKRLKLGVEHDMCDVRIGQSGRAASSGFT